ncbi:MAG TPA: hypothetical protein VGL61_28685 [Kofleriaceae bacterium]|jgi:hypothetical protein
MLIRFATTTFAVSLVAALVTGCTVTTNDDDDDSSASLTIVNDESFDIDNIFISPSGFAQSDDILGGTVLEPSPAVDDTITVTVDCGTYDIEIVDDSGVDNDCYISDYSLCGTDDEWDITDDFFNSSCSSTEPRTPTTASHSPSPVLQVRR